MSDLEQAKSLLSMAEKDCRALRGMDDTEIFSTEIFGFHVQQAVEKALKAWLCALGTRFPKTHDLDELDTLIEQSGQNVPASLAGLLEFTDFAVAFRYDAFAELEGDIDRRSSCEQVQALLDHIRAFVSEAR